MKKYFKIVPVFLLITFASFAQQQIIDSSFSKKSNREQAQYYYEKAFEFPNKEVDSVIYYTQLVYSFSKECNCDTLIMKSSNILGYFYRLKKDYKQAFHFDSISYSTALKLKNNLRIYNSANELGILFEIHANYIESEKYYTEALQLAHKMKDSVRIISTQNNIGGNYVRLGQFELAESFFLSNLKYLENSESLRKRIYPELVHIIYTNLAIVYRNLQNKEAAFFYLNKVTPLEGEEFNETNNIDYQQLKGDTYFNFKEYDQALQSYKKQLEFSAAKKDTANLILAHISLANVSTKLKDFGKAQTYFEKYQELKNITEKSNIFNYSNIEDSKYYYEIGAEVYKNTGDYKKALIFSELLVKTLDSINTKKTDDTFAEYGKKFETEQKDKEIALQQLEISKQKTQRNLYIFGSVLLLLLLTILYLMIYFKQEKKKNTIKLALNNEKEFRKLRSHFLENISHEIRTPITLIQGYINLIKKHKNSSKEIENYADKALLQSSKAIDDANDVLQLLKVEKAMLTLKNTKRPLNVFINDTFFAFKHKAQQEYQSLHYLTNINNALEVVLDYEKLEKVLTNLISNALKYSPQYTEITVQCVLTSESLSLIVRDEGIGIAIDEQDKIFSKFYQTINNKTTGGLGIGLSLVKELTQFLNGAITVDSELGKGACFTLKIPIEISDKLSLYLEKNETYFTPIEEEFTSLKQEIAGHRQVLIVDDNKEIVNYLKEILTPNFNCDSAYNGIEALSKVKEKPYDLILSDLMMPEMDGFEFKKELNKIQGYERIPFLMLTANALIETKIEGFTIGINDYITKPFNERELIARIKNLLKNKQLQNETIRLFDESDILIDDSKSFDKQFLDNVTQIVQGNLDNETFKVSDLAFECSYSRRQLTRIIKKITGLTPAKFILELRLLKAYELIINKTYPNLNEVMYTVGISTYHSFNTTFYSRFGIKPNELLKMKKSTN